MRWRICGCARSTERNAAAREFTRATAGRLKKHLTTGGFCGILRPRKEGAEYRMQSGHHSAGRETQQNHDFVVVRGLGLFSLKIRTQQNKNFVAFEAGSSADRSCKAADVLLLNQLYYFDKGLAIGSAVFGFLLFCLILMFFLYCLLNLLRFFKNGQKTTLQFSMSML